MELNEEKEAKNELETKEESKVKEKKKSEVKKEENSKEIEEKKEVEVKEENIVENKENNKKNDCNNEQYEIKSKKSKKTLIMIICSIFIVLILLLSTGFALFNINNNKIISNVFVEGIELGKLSKEEAKQKLLELLEKNVEQDITVKSDDFEYQFKLSQIETSYDTDKAIEDAYNIGRDGNIFENNLEILKSKIKSRNINLGINYNEELLNNIINDMAVKLPGAVEEANYCIEENKLIITKGKAGNSINKEKFKEEVIKRIELKDQGKEINLEIVNSEPQPIDIDKIYNEVHKEAKNAYYTKDPFQVYPHVEGVDFDVEAAKEM